jgi:subtilisin family serine protease
MRIMARLFNRGGTVLRDRSGPAALAWRAGLADADSFAMQSLEGRVHLAASPVVQDTLNWYGFNYQVDQGSWVLAFHDQTNQQTGEDRARAVAHSLGIEPTYVQSTPTGKFVKFETGVPITEGQTQAALRNTPGLEAFTPDFLRSTMLIPDDTRFAEEYAHLNTGQFIAGLGNGTAGADMKSTEAWNTSTGSRQVVVAISDTGVDYTHPDLAANIWVNPGEIPANNIDDDGNGYVDDVNGWDFANNDNNPTDPATQGHGTSVAGCIGAVGNNGQGVAGVMWTTQIMICKVFPDDGLAPLFSITAAAEYTAMMRRDFGINVVASNNSYGALTPDQTGFFDSAEELAIQEFTDAGGVFVASAGNDSNDNDGTNRAYPASYDNPFIVSVAATQNTDNLTGFSNFGATTVDVGAPGERILTTERGGGYRFIDGTSFSGPYTAGAVGLLAAVNPFATQSQLRDALFGGVDVVTGLQGRIATNGRVNIARSIGLVGTPGPNVLSVFPGNPSAPVDTVRVQFSENIDPGFFTTGAIELRRARGDRDFNGNDEIYSFPPTIATLDGQVLTIRFSAGVLPVDLYRLTLTNTGFRDFEGNRLNGDLDSGNDFVYQFELTPATGAFEPNDDIQQATPVVIGSDHTALFESAFLGDGLNPTLDVDVFKVTVNAPSLITAEVIARNLLSPSTLDSYMRLFDPTGAELAHNDNFRGLDSRIQYFVPNGGTYYIGISGFGNGAYTSTQLASGTLGQSNGGYNLSFRVDTAANETVAYQSTPNTPILDQGTISDSIFIPDSRSVLDLNVSVHIDHSFVGDLTVRLTGPQGQSTTLIANRGGAGDNIGDSDTLTLFDDSATTPISSGVPPFTSPGAYRPESELQVFKNTVAAGVWTLTVTDSAPLNSGTLREWKLTLTLENQFSGAFELNDTRSVATDVGFTGVGTRTFDAFIGDGAFGQRDVDMFKLTLDAGTTLNAAVVVPTLEGGSVDLFDSVLRLFDSQGNELRVVNRADSQNSALSFPVQFAGVYYVAVSGAGNTNYTIDQGGSGAATAATGGYSITIGVVGGISAGEVTLAGSRMSAGFASDGSLGLTAPSQIDPLGLTLDGVDFIYSSQQDAESFFGAIFGGFVFKNAGPGRQSDLPVVMANESDAFNRRVTTEGLFRAVVQQDDQSGGLLVNRSVSFGVNDTFMAFDVTLTNTTFFSLDGVGWVEAFNPNQSLNLGSGFPRTVNNIDNATGRLATASYTDTQGRFPNGLTFGLAAAAPGAGQSTPVLSVENANTVRDAFQVVGSVTDPDPTALDAGTLGEGTLAVAYNVGALAPGASTHLRYFVILGTSTADVRSTFTSLDNGTSTGHLVADPNDAAINPSTLPYALYYPEGFANDRAQTFVPVVNPNDDPTRVVMIARYEDPSLAPVTLMDRVVAPKSRDGITITTPTLYAQDQQLVQKQKPYAVEIRSSRPVGATLSHYDFGISTGESFTSKTSSVWAFSEGFKGTGVSDFLVFYNPNLQQIKVTLTVYPEGSGSPKSFVQSIDGQHRGGWSLAEMTAIADGPFGMKISADQPIVAALTHFDTNTHGGFGVVGLPSAGITGGSSPEGQIGVHASTEFITILNTNSQVANVTFSFFFESGSTYRRLIQVPANHRGGFSVAELPGFPGTGEAYSVGFTSDIPVVADTSSFAFGEAVGSSFTGTGGNTWLFSEGFRPASGTGVQDLLRLFNPSSASIAIEVTMNFAPNPAFNDNGGSEVFRVTISPRAANVIDVHQFVTGARATRDTFFSYEVRSPIPVVAYADHADSFLGGAFGTLGTVLGEPGAAI